MKAHPDIFDEEAVTFQLNNNELVGIHHASDKTSKTGILIVVGGRQYRAGSHRQFTLLARHLSKSGAPVFRFDVRGMGDSTGNQRHFLEINEDIAAAISQFKSLSPQVENIILWGLCDGASAAIIGASSLPKISGVILVNPWISTDDGAARVQLKHYYRGRFFSGHFWQKMISGKVNWFTSLVSFLSTLRKQHTQTLSDTSSNLPDTVFDSIEQYEGPVFIALSEHDFSAREFEEEYWKRHKLKNTKLRNAAFHRIEADHTFSEPEHHKILCELTVDFVNSVIK